MALDHEQVNYSWLINTYLLLLMAPTLICTKLFPVFPKTLYYSIYLYGLSCISIIFFYSYVIDSTIHASLQYKIQLLTTGL